MHKIFFNRKVNFPVSKPYKTNKNAFTLIEMLIVIVIIGAMSVTSMAYFVKNSSTRNANRVAEYFVGDVVLVRNKALAGSIITQGTPPTPAYWSLRVQCNTSNYSLGYSTNGTDFISNQNKTLETGFKFFSASTCDVNTKFVYLDFKRLYGELDSNSATITITNSSGTGGKTITIYKNGKISL